MFVAKTPLTEAELAQLETGWDAYEHETDIVASIPLATFKCLIAQAKRAMVLEAALRTSAEALKVAIETHENGNCAAEDCWYPRDLQSLALTAARAALRDKE